MIGQCYIDGRDIYSDFGVIITDGGYDDFFKLPGMVEPDKNDWAEEDGIEVDLAEPRLQPREIVVSFANINHIQWRAFVEYITQPKLREVSIPYLGKTWTLRYDSMTELDIYSGSDLFAIKFIEDEYEIPEVVIAPSGSAPIVSVLELDGISLDRYGIVIEDGLNDFDKTPALKRNLTRTSSAINGQVYDAEVALFTEKEVTIRCTMLAGSMAGLWAQLGALYSVLMHPDVRVLSYSGRGYEGYYRRFDNVQLLTHMHEVALRFDLKMNFTAFRVGFVTYLIAAEDNRLITTEYGYNIEIGY